MELIKKELIDWRNDMLALLDQYGNGLDNETYLAKSKNIQAGLDWEITQSATNIKQSKFPYTSSLSNEYKKLGEEQKTRAYMLMDKDINLIKREAKKELDQGNKEFFFTLIESVFEDESRDKAERAGLSNLYLEALQKVGAPEHIKNNKDAKMLKQMADVMVDLFGRDEHIKDVREAHQRIEMGNARDAEINRSKPEYVKHVESLN